MAHQKQPKRSTRYVAYAAVSIDGYISADTSRMPDWTSKEDWKYFQTALAKASAVVVGSRTYRAAKDHIDKRVACVFTSKVTKPKITGSVTFLNPKRTDIGSLCEKHKTVAIVGGSEVYQTMLDYGLFDELHLTIEPVVLGGGTPLFSGGELHTDFKLISVKKLNSRGTIVLRYIRTK